MLMHDDDVDDNHDHDPRFDDEIQIFDIWYLVDSIELSNRIE
jgi:hypothetical protein